MSGSVQPPTNGNEWCPYGGTQQLGNPCGITFDVLAAGFLFFLFTGNIPAAIADIVAAFVPGVFSVGTLCAPGPPSCPDFSLSWLIPFQYPSPFMNVTSWLLCNAQLFAWEQCCQCAPPPVPGFTLVAYGTFPPSTTHHCAYYCLTDGDTGSYEAKYQIYANGPITGGEQYGISWNTAATCNGSLTSQGSICYGPGGDESYGAYYQTAQFVLGAGNSTLAAAICAPQSGTCPGAQTGATMQWWLFLQPTTPETIVLPSQPPSLAPSVPELPSGFPAPVQTAPTYAGYCNWAPISANEASGLLVPQGSNETGAAQPISGSGTWSLPGGTAWIACTLTAIPSNASKDSGDPAELYQVGWLQWLDAAGFALGPRVLITFAQQLLRRKPPVAVTLAYNLYPGYAAEVQAYNYPTPT